jgi:hypothetical protein
VRIKDLTAGLIQLTFSPGAFQDQPLSNINININININAIRDRCEFCYATESALMRYPRGISLTRYPS